MDYFLVRPDLEIGVPVPVQPFIQAGGPAVQMSNFDENQCFPDLYQCPAWLFSERLKQLLALYEPELPWTPFVLSDAQRGAQKNYFLTSFPVVDCVSQQSEFTLSKRIRRFVLKRKAVEGRHIIVPVLENEAHLLFSLPLAESVLRRGLYGICLERVAAFEEE